jgi:uncharacterized protein
MTSATDGAAPPVTVVVTRQVRPGRSAEFQRLMNGMRAAAAAFPGHMGGFTIPPDSPGQDCWRTLFAFDTPAHLNAWTRSAERAEWVARMSPLTYGDGAVRVLSGLETWFALPAAQTKAPPPRWKMALVTWSGIFPLVLLASHTVTPLFASWWPQPLAVLGATGLIVAAMTWLVMPLLARLLAAWLYPAAREP